jgi:hypothetical protein
MAQGILLQTEDEGVIYKILKMKDGRVVKLTCQILRVNKLVIFRYELIE